MEVYKCKMCGGNLLPAEREGTGICDSCGSISTLPKSTSDKKLNLYNRANHFRLMNDFDKALTAYEMILNEDNEDSEAHWGIVLSRYGIEYIEDPTTHERIPTCHRMQYTPILTDSDYLAALEFAENGDTRGLFEAEAKAISEIQKEILAISKKEEPYDVFISYKEQSETGERTRDSVIAQEIYYRLEEEGYRVFFSKITLEEKLGQEYEPYIFSALHSAKVMIVVGTTREYFNAVWVKNEWSRFLNLMKKDKSRTIIPCYRDMDPYDLPEELSLLQALDMNKIGFIQDLVRGIKKITTTRQNTQNNQVEVSQKDEKSSLLKRAFIFLSDEEYERAEEYLEKVLDHDPLCAEAYFGKFLAEKECKDVDTLLEFAELIWFQDSSNYEKAIRFAATSEKLRYRGYEGKVRERVEKEEKEIEEDRQRRIEIAEIKASKKRKAKKRFFKISFLLLLIFIVIQLILGVRASYREDMLNYNKAIELLNERNYSEAYKLFTLLADTNYKDARERSSELEFEMTLNPKGGVFQGKEDSIKIKFIDLYKKFSTPHRDGYTFAGWWTGEEGTGTQISAENVVPTESNHTLYAQWSANEYSVSFDSQKGTQPEPKSKSVIYDQTYGELPVVTRDGYTFNGWWTGEGGAGTQISATTAVSTATNHTLYAKWIGNEYTVSFDNQGGTQPEPKSKSVTYDQTYGDLPTVTKSGYTFDGWWTEEGGTGTQISAVTVVSTATNHTLYAKWLPQYTITFDGQGGIQLEPKSKSVTYDQKYGELPTVTKLGYTFIGWGTKEGGAGTQISAETVVSTASNQTLYAKWRELQIGDNGPAGGHVFYDKGDYRDGWRYLEAAPASYEYIEKVWGGYGTAVEGTGTAIGTGASNTQKIVENFGHAEPWKLKPDYAAKLCADLVITKDGVVYDDWFLPSKDELNLLYQNIYRNNLSGFFEDLYWSSSEYNTNLAWGQDFSDGRQGISHRDNSLRVRPVRAF